VHWTDPQIPRKGSSSLSPDDAPDTPLLILEYPREFPAVIEFGLFPLLSLLPQKGTFFSGLH